MGALAVIAGIAAMIEAHSHHTSAYSRDEYSQLTSGRVTVEHAATGLSRTAYDLIRIGGWALVILGAATLIPG